MSEDKEIKMPNFLVDLAFKDYIKVLSDIQAGKLFKMLVAYADGQSIDESKLSSGAKITFEALKSTVDKGKDKYVKKVLRNREIAKNRKKKTDDNQTKTKVNQTETNGNQTYTKKDQNKLNKSKLVSKDTNLRLKDSSQGLPEGQPAPRPEHYELREFFEKQFGYDDAYFCSEFTFAMEKDGNDWQNWQRKMLAYAVKTGRASYE